MKVRFGKNLTTFTLNQSIAEDANSGLFIIIPASEKFDMLSEALASYGGDISELDDDGNQVAEYHGYEENPSISFQYRDGERVFFMYLTKIMKQDIDTINQSLNSLDSKAKTLESDVEANKTDVASALESVASLFEMITATDETTTESSETATDTAGSTPETSKSTSETPESTSETPDTTTSEGGTN